MSIIYSIYLLSEFKDKKLFPILIDMYSKDSIGMQDIIIEQYLNSKLERIIISVFDGNFKALNSIIENKEIDEFTRESFLISYGYFYKEKMISKKELESYLRKLIKLYDYKEDYIYNVIIDVIVYASLFDMREDVRTILEEVDGLERESYSDFIDEFFDNQGADNILPIENTIEEIYYLSEEDEEIDYEEIEEKWERFLEEEQKEIDKYKNIKRNDLCPCGSGKKYKKCCLNKEIKILPYQKYINDDIDDYPKRKENDDELDLFDFYKEKYIEIDKLLYKGLKEYDIPENIKRDYLAEDKNALAYFSEAFEKINEVVSENNFKTLDEYDKVVSIHFKLIEYIINYGNKLRHFIDKNINNKREEYLKKLEEVIKFAYNNFELTKEEELVTTEFLRTIFYYSNKLEEGIKYFENKLDYYDIKFKHYIYLVLFDLIMCKYDDINKLDEYIKKEEDEYLKIILEDERNEYYIMNYSDDEDDSYYDD